jgi:ATPase subunit of ABC transporter with duplicated ATPase domains
LGKDVIDLEDVSLAFGEQGEKQILTKQTFRLGPGDRFGVVGVNGAGKTTLLALLADRLKQNSGKIKRGKTVVVAELTQNLADLDALGDLTPVQVIEKEKGTITVGKDGPGFLARTSMGSGKVGELTASQLTERLGFTSERAHTRLSELSGGERRRLQLARLLVGQPNVLLLDEPTNDLDTDTLAAIEDLLDTWQGTLVVVSHDRYLLERVTDRQWAMYGDGKIVDLPGGVDEYLRVLAGGKPSAPERPEPRLETTALPAGVGVTPEQRRQARKDVQRIEKRLAKIDDDEAKLHQLIADNPTDYSVTAEADQKLRALGVERETLEAEWLTAAELTEG